ncbi:MAG: hypothetical protein ACRD0X_00215 [Thermoanaerobaculia bacterium]
MAENESGKLPVTCPGCGSRLTVDGATGEVLAHRPLERAPAGGKSFEGLLAGLDRERAEAEDVFAREVAAVKDRDRLLEEKFRAAVERAREDPDEGPPPRPFDFD